jgi:hypothetical protein
VVFNFEIDPIRDLSYPDANGKRLLESGDFHVQVGNQKLTFELVESLRTTAAVSSAVIGSQATAKTVRD